MEINNTTAIVTGAASGMGQATAIALAAKGCKVALLDINQSEQINNCLVIQCDVTDETSAQSAIDKVIAELGAPRILVNCAGVILAKRMVGRDGPMPLADFTKVININLIGSFNMARLVADVILKNKLNDAEEQGIIINTASIAAFDGQIGQAAYSASKGGIVAMTLPLARELAKFGVRVMTLAPGLMDTPMLEKLSDNAKQNLIDSTLFPKRLGKPAEFAQMVLSIINNPLLNGEVIRLDGGVRLR